MEIPRRDVDFSMREMVRSQKAQEEDVEGMSDLVVGMPVLSM